MSDRDAVIGERAAASAADLLENGPRLWTGRQSWVVARSGVGHVLRGGLGGFGHGTMWCNEEPRDLEDETLETAPVDPYRRDDFGATICVTCKQQVRPTAEGEFATVPPERGGGCDHARPTPGS